MGKYNKSIEEHRAKIEQTIDRMSDARAVLNKLIYENWLDCVRRSYTYCMDIKDRTIALRWAIDILSEQCDILMALCNEGRVPSSKPNVRVLSGAEESGQHD